MRENIKEVATSLFPKIERLKEIYVLPEFEVSEDTALEIQTLCEEIEDCDFTEAEANFVHQEYQAWASLKMISEIAQLNK